MRTKKFDKCIINEMEEDIRKELKEIREDFIIMHLSNFFVLIDSTSVDKLPLLNLSMA
jgi:hypothetical protein